MDWAKKIISRRSPMPGPNALVAAAIIGPQEFDRPPRPVQDWQCKAWDYYDAIPELRFAANWVGNALSRATLHIGRLPEGGGSPVLVDDAEGDAILGALAGGAIGQSEILQALGVHMTVPGEAYLIGLQEPDGSQRWLVRSFEEVRPQIGAVLVKVDGVDRVYPSDSIALIRIWRPHPRRSWEADSATRSVLGLLYELQRLTEMVVASANSRLAGAGLLLLPNEFSFPEPATGTGPVPAPGGGTPVEPDASDDQDKVVTQAQKLQTFTNLLGQAMVRPITDRADPSSVVPLLLTAPGEQIKNAQLIQFWTKLDEQAIELRKEAIRRIALGMDIPAEILLGLSANANHWAAFLVDENAVKIHLEPLLALICDALTVGYLRPLLPDSDLVIWYDISRLVQRPNRGPAALNVYDRYGLSLKALRSEHGFTEDDAPTEEEVKLRLLQTLVSGAGGALGPDAARQLGILFPQQGVVQPKKEPEEEPPTTPDVRDGMTVPMPAGVADAEAEVADLAAAGWSPTARVLATHCLDYMAKRWSKGISRSDFRRDEPRHKLHERLPVPADRIEMLLAGAWTAFEDVAPPELLEAITNYVRFIATTGQPYDNQAIDTIAASLSSIR